MLPSHGRSFMFSCRFNTPKFWESSPRGANQLSPALQRGVVRKKRSAVPEDYPIPSKI